MSSARDSLAVRLVPSEANDDTRLVEELTDLVNRVYAVAEEGLWVDGATRTTAREMRELIADTQIAVATVGGQVAGCVRIDQLDADTGEFGTLAVTPDHRGSGVGGTLVRFAEERSRMHGATTMRLELLVPREWLHPSKELLKAWYTGMGYRLVDTANMDAAYPHLAPLLATPCDLLIYDKAM
jgi:N-acetylglutamate synthase-like GNAT family acetyltransferase